MKTEKQQELQLTCHVFDNFSHSFTATYIVNVRQLTAVKCPIPKRQITLDTNLKSICKT